MNQEETEEQFEQHDRLYADWQMGGDILQACAEIIKTTDVDTEEDFKLLLSSIHFTFQNLVRMWESDVDVMDNINMFKRFREIEVNLTETVNNIEENS
jgi:hypothetical protein